MSKEPTVQKEKIPGESGFPDHQDSGFDLPLAMIVFNPEGRLLSANPAMAGMLGYSSAEEMVRLAGDMPAKIFARSEDWENILPLVQSQRQIRDFECTLLTAEGSMIWGALNADVPSDRRRRSNCYRGCFIDISERKKKELSLEEDCWRLQCIIDGADIGTWEWNVQTGEARVNDTFARILGYSLNELSPVTFNTWKKLVHPDDLKRSNELIERHLSGKSAHYECECRMRHKNGYWIWALDRGRLASRTPDGSPLLMSGSHTEISSLKETEKRLKEREESLSAVLRDTPALLCRFTAEGIITYVNEEYCRYFNKTRDELISSNFLDLIPEEDREYVWQKFTSLTPDNPVITYEHRVTLPQGEMKWQRWTDRCIFDEQGTPLVYQSIGIDITESKQLEESLRESEQRFSKAFKSSPAPQVISDMSTGEIIDVNLRTLELSGYSRVDLVGRNAEELEIWADQAKRKRITRKLKIKGYLKNEPIELKGGNGRMINALWSAQSIYMSGRRLMLSMFYDETERRRAEKALKESRESLIRERYRLQIITDTMAQGLYVLDEEGRITFVNPAAASMLGYSREDLLGRVAHSLFHSDCSRKDEDPAEDCQCFQTVFSGKDYFGEEPFRHRDGTVFQAEVVSRPMIKDGRVTGAVGVFSDISERKKAEHNLRESEEKYRALMEQSLDMIFVHDLEGNFLEVNQAAVKRTGYSREELLDMGVFDLHPDQSGREEILEMSRKWSPGDSTILELVHVDKHGRKYPVEINTGKVRFGNKDYILATVRDITERKKVQEDLKKSRLRFEYLLQSSAKRNSFQNIIGRSRQMQHVYAMIHQVAGVDTTVLITGETGTGKELIAEALHASSPRSKGPLIKINCLTLSDDLLDSELFGHVKGAFTGAYADKIGRVEAAEGGTIFLDEIGDLTERIQLKLLRFLQEKEYERVGESKTRKADVRIVAATNADLDRRVEQGRFRKDLYYRLKVIKIHVPPLKERNEDIPLLIEHFCRHFAEKFSRNINGVSPEVMKIMLKYTWPGNVRELEHVLEHGTLLCPEGLIDMVHLPEELLDQELAGPQLQTQAASVNREDLIRALKATGGKKTQAAKMLGISRRTLYRKLHKFDLLK